MQLIIQLGVILTNPKNNNNSGDNNTNSLFKITKEINNMKEEIKKTNNNLMKYLPKKAIEDKINLINDNRCISFSLYIGIFIESCKIIF